MNISEQIENDIKRLKEKRLIEDKIKQYDLIASRIGQFFKNTGIKRFQKTLILSFFERDFFKPRTQQRHLKNILDTLRTKGIITDGITTKTTKQRRIYSLKCSDGESYNTLMKANGYTTTDYYKYICDSDGIPRRKKVYSSGINGQPTDENGEIVEGDKWDFSSLRQTKPRIKQGVFVLNEKSIAHEERRYNTKCFNVC